MQRQHKLIAIVIAVGFGFWIVGRVTGLLADYLWFEALGYASVFTRILWTELAIGGGVFVVVAGWLAGNAMLAARLAPGRRLGLTEVHPWLTPAHLRQMLRVVGGLMVLAIALAMAQGYSTRGLGTQPKWYTLLQFLHGQPFVATDPILGRNVGFYVYALPVLEEIQSLVLWLTLLGLAAAGIAYFVHGAIGTQYIRLTKAATRHMALLGALFFLTVGFGYWLTRFELLLRPAGVVFGAGWTDVHVRLPGTWVLVAASAAAAGLMVYAGFAQKKRPAMAAPLVVAAAHVLVLFIAPGLVQRLKVQPNELALEREYLAHNIRATREAFGLGAVTVREYPGERGLTAEDMAVAEGTIRNIRLWDYRVLRDVYQELQGLRTYYLFNTPDVDRYRIPGDYRQVSVAVRELEQGRLDRQSRTWVNERLIYTHGYGLVMSPVNEVSPNGTPHFWIENIPPRSAESVGIPLERAGVYFGERTDAPVFVGTTTKEFHYPMGDSNVETRYDGKAGIPITSLARRLLFAYVLGDVNVLVTTTFTSETRLLWRRDVMGRVGRIAPFLQYDRDPYPVVHDGRIVWILDAYTFTDRYPYSARVQAGGLRRGPNYIRNAVKAVVDAYDGTVRFYVADPSDPLVRTAAAVFPSLFEPMEAMPAGLRRHLRYPVDLFETQAAVYMRYHMTDPTVFYNKEDLWERPMEFNWSSRQGQNAPTPVVSYYVIMTLPGETEPEYLLMLPFSPRAKNNMVGWMAGRCDGEQYGKLLVFQFPKDRLIQGPSQVEARIDKTDAISQQLTLWDQMGSRVGRGNLLVIPVAGSVLYVEPLYLDSEQTPFPELKRVIVATKDAIAMRPTLAEALAAVFGQAAPSPPTEVPPGTTYQPPAEGTPQAVGTLIQRASQLFEEALRAQRAGDWATYGRAMDELGTVIRQIEGAASPDGAAPDGAAPETPEPQEFGGQDS